MKATLNWWHWILFSVPAVSPHPASVWQTHHPSHRKSPLTGPAAASSWSSFIIPADWLVERRADRWGRSPAGDLAGAKPWRVLCMNGGLVGWGGKPVITQRQEEAGGRGCVGVASNAFGCFAASNQHWCHIRAPAKASGGKNSLPSRNPSEMCTRDYPINRSNYAHWRRRGEAISSPSAHLGRYHRWLQEMPCFCCRRPPPTHAPPPSLTHTHISLAELSAIMTDLLCPSHPFALPPERNATQRSIHTFHLCRSPSIVNNRR